MMLFKLSFKNIRKSFKDYAIYFFTLILGIAIFYIFNSLGSQAVMLNLTKTSNNAVSMMVKALEVISVFVSFILGFLIIYANRFLIKRRNREFGIYMTLGMGKTTISKIIVVETICVGIISLLVGLVLGAALSQVMSIIVANLFEADMTKFKFIISYKAILKTIVYFCIIFFIVMIFNIIQVNRCKLIELIQGAKKSEQIKMKNPYVCIGVFIFSVILLGYAYYNVTCGVGKLITMSSVVIQVIYGVLGTFLIFWSLSGLILKLVMSLENLYYKNLNSFILRQISSKINTTVVSMSIICIMIFLTICIFSSAVSMNSSLKEGMKKLATADISIYKNINLPKVDDYGEEYSNEEIANSHLSIEEALKDLNFPVNKNLTDVEKLNIYKSEDVTLKDTLGIEDDAFSDKEDLIKISEYNKIAKLYGMETFELKDNEYIIVCNVKNSMEMRNKGLEKNNPITIKGSTYRPKYKKCKDGYIMMTSEPQNFGLVLVPDNAVNSSMIKTEVLVANFIGNDKDEKQVIEDKITDIRDMARKKNLGISTKIDIYNSNIGTSAMTIFIGLYIGIVFLISSAAILALKELSESADCKERYEILRKIGIDERMINRSLFIQSGVFFALPIILAIIHSIFGIKVCNMMLETFGRSGMLKTICITAVFLIVIYGGYFVITYLCSKSIIKEE